MDRLYTYRCLVCHTTMTTTVRRTLETPPYRCRGCASYLRELFSEPITTDEQRARAKQGIVWNNTARGVVNTRRQCDECHGWVERHTMIELGRFLRFCSPACADRGTERHRAVMEQQQASLEQLYTERPWLRPQAKEIA